MFAGWLSKTGVGVEKVRQQKVISAASMPCRFFSLSVRLSGAGQNRLVGWVRTRTSRLRFLGHGDQEELLPHELQPAQAQAVQANLILESANSASTFCLCRCAWANSAVLANSRRLISLSPFLTTQSISG
jgi:hypothetical protein